MDIDTTELIGLLAALAALAAFATDALGGGGQDSASNSGPQTLSLGFNLGGGGSGTGGGDLPDDIGGYGGGSGSGSGTNAGGDTTSGGDDGPASDSGGTDTSGGGGSVWEDVRTRATADESSETGIDDGDTPSDVPNYLDELAAFQPGTRADLATQNSGDGSSGGTWVGL